MTRPNPFRSATKAKAPKLSEAAKAAINEGKIDPLSPVGREIKEHMRSSPATRFDLLDLSEVISGEIKSLRKDVRELQGALAYAQSEAAKALDADLREPLERDTGKTLKELDQMAQRQKEARR